MDGINGRKIGGAIQGKRRLDDYFRVIVSFATFAPPGVEVNTTLRCRRRPNRRNCIGLIHLHLGEAPAELHWWCPVCGDRGVIRNLRGTLCCNETASPITK